MKDKEKQIEEMAKEIFNTCAWRFGNPNDYKEAFNDIAEDLTKLNYQKVNEDSVVLSREEFEKSLQEKYEQGKFDIQCDLEKHDKYLLTKRKYAEIMREGQCITDLINKAKNQASKETAEKIIAFIETLKVKEDGRHQWRDNHNDCIDRVILKLNQKFINGVEIKE